MKEFFKNAIRNITAKSTGNDRKGQIISRIVEQSNNRAKKDIHTWRQALMSAENKTLPNRVKLYDLYEDLLLDNHIRNIQKRLYRMVAKNRVVLTKDKKVNEELSKLFAGKWYKDMIRHIVDSKLWGHSLIEFERVDDKIICWLIPRKHILPEVGGFRTDAYQTNYEVYRNDPFYMQRLLEVGGNFDLGELAAAAPNILFKKNATVAWSEYTEIFGMPIRVGKTNSRNPNDIGRMESQMISMGKAPYAVIDANEQIEFVESTKGDAFKVYDMLIERMNSEVSKLFLGETLTTDVGKNGSRAQSQVHQDVSVEVAKELEDWVLNILNEDVAPILLNLGFNIEGHEIGFANDSQSDLETDKWLDEKFEIDAQFWADKYNVPIKEKKAVIEPTPPNPDPIDDPEDKTIVLKSKLENLLENPIVKMHAEIDQIYNDTHSH